MKQIENWEVYLFGELQPVLFVSNQYKAVLMPYRKERIS